MKRNCIIICSILLISHALISCVKSKEACICEYEYYINEIEKEHSNYTDKKWAKMNKKLDSLQRKLKRYEKKLTPEDKKRLKYAFNIYAKYREGIQLPFNEELSLSKDEENDEKDKRDKKISSIDIDADDRLEELRKITEQQQEIFLQLQQLRQKLETEVPKENGGGNQKTEKELLASQLENELLMKVLEEKKEGRREIHGKIMVLVFPTNYKNNYFNMDYRDLEDGIEKALEIIRTQAKRYGENISIDYQFMVQNDNSYVSLNSSDEALERYEEYTSSFYDYDLVSAVYAINADGRSYCSQMGRLGNSISNAIMWYKGWGGHSAGTLAHELFHTLGADDLYYEEGIVPKEVEDNFHKLVGDSIMINAEETNGLDPINAWLIGWNDRPEPWYAWFVDRRKSLDVDW